MNIDVHIERLVLDGLPFSSRDGEAVAAAIQTELAGMLVGGARVFESRLAPQLVAGSVDGTPTRTTTGVGIQVVRCIHRSLVQPQ